jgi:hypothetical protein
VDPNETLAQIRSMVAHVLGPDWRHEPAPNFELIVTTIASDFDALDTWLSSGGFPPAEWSGPRHLSEPS